MASEGEAKRSETERSSASQGKAKRSEKHSQAMEAPQSQETICNAKQSDKKGGAEEGTLSKVRTTVNVSACAVLLGSSQAKRSEAK